MKLLIITCLFLFQQQEDGPEFPNQPLQCDNYKMTAPEHRCDCARARQNCEGKLPQGPADVRMDKSCKTYCKQQHCNCAGHACRS